MCASMIISYDGTPNDDDALALGKMLAPAGFLLAVRDDQLLGYHWTKVHSEPQRPRDEALGEVYVLGVDPLAQGLNLGKVLLIAGLNHLRDMGLHTVLLYVDESNVAAVNLYRKLGFTLFSNDVQFSLREASKALASESRSEDHQ